MEKLFGLEMATIAGCLTSALLLVVGALALLAWRRPVMFKLGVRPIPRRRAQSTLIVLGLMLATLIITAAFVTGDTLSSTIRALALEGMGEIDETVEGGRGQATSSGSAGPGYFRIERHTDLAEQLAGYDLIDHVLPAINDTLPVVNATQRRSLRSIGVFGLRPEDIEILAREEITDASGQVLALEALTGNELYLNAEAARALSAQPGDVLELYVDRRPERYTVRAIAAQGQNARILMRLDQAQSLFNAPGHINLILVSNQGDALSGIAHSQEVTTHLRGLLSDPQTANRIFSLLARDPSAATAISAAAAKEEGNTQADLQALVAGLQSGSLTPEVLSLLADTGLTDRVQSILTDANWGTKSLRDRLADHFGALSDLTVSDNKRDLLDQGELAASAFTTIFIVSGLFGIAAGVILIFLIFVMLAAERKSEMGMARAVGAQRGHLMEMFVFEGTAYDLLAAAVGVALGVGAGLIIATTLGQAFAGQGLAIKPTFTARSLLISYALGMLVTFATVLISAYRVSRLNIVAAIRDLPEPPRAPTYVRDVFLGPIRQIGEVFRLIFNLKLLQAFWAWVVGVPASLWRIVWLGFTAGPLTLLLGLVLFPLGLQTTSAAAYSIGISLIILGGGRLLRLILLPLLKRWPGLADRVAYSTLGLAMTLFWSLPSGVIEERMGVPELSGGAEMLFISGIFLVMGAVLIIMYNADLLLRGILLVLGGSPRFAPVLRMAIAYPLANRYRTGMTIGIFAVVMFSVIFMATLFKVNDVLLTDTDSFTGGFDLRVASSHTNPVEDLPRAITSQPRLNRADYAVVAAQYGLSVELQQNRGDRWAGYYINAVDEAYLNSLDYEVGVKAIGYETSEEIWAAVRDNPGYAVVDRLAVPTRTTTSFVIGGPDFKLQGVYLEDETMQPITIQARDPETRTTFELTIIGVLEQSALTGYGLMASAETLEREWPTELPTPTYYIVLPPDVDPGQAGAALESAFLKNGLEAVDQAQELRDAMQTQLVFQQLLLGFLTLGLVVGVAALGVISTRAVVERRQQIGMLRALGFQREMISWSFIIESAFVALLGIGLGAGLALIPAYQMVTDMAVDIPGVTFQVPWTELLLTSGLAFGMTLLTTWLPSIQASRVTPAEALRYE
ncbi:MAG TPA: FtsX-like permease family protein [Anaerolineales bacterium]|nr:FtsX-like permease family protein [Anaerolineales bacterium]